MSLKRRNRTAYKVREMALSLFHMGIPSKKIAEAANVDVALVESWLKEE